MSLLLDQSVSYSPSFQIGRVLKLGITTVRTFRRGYLPISHGRRIDSDDIKNVDLTKVHNLTGPIAIEGAEPGDALVVDILDGMLRCNSRYMPRSKPHAIVTPFPQMPWGYTVRFAVHEL
jgi:hypothetical protein